MTYGPIDRASQVVRIDPAPIVPGYDARHDQLELRATGRLLAGSVDAVHVAAVRAWAHAEGLDADAVTAVVPELATVTRSRLLRGAPQPSAEAVTSVRLGEPVEIVAREGAWRKVRTGSDRYLGWIHEGALTLPGPEATHLVTQLRSHAYAAPRVQGEVLAELAWGDRLRVRTEEGTFAEVVLPDGRTAFVPTPALTTWHDVRPIDPLETWRGFLGAPYLWGGGSAWGLDCSGLMQLLFRMAGVEVPRDGDEQWDAGREVENPEPGDVVCMRGHVGLYLGDGRMAHASGRAMRVVDTPVIDGPKDEARFLGYVRFG
ncbi:MAG: NlpC/P60 family protein [Trueperaceae bacterium]|nr:NlpC/P60 family protein [Trueperaceae bacterium]